MGNIIIFGGMHRGVIIFFFDFIVNSAIRKPPKGQDQFYTYKSHSEGKLAEKAECKTVSGGEGYMARDTWKGLGDISINMDSGQWS